MKHNRWKEAMQALAAAQSVVPLGDNAPVYRHLEKELTCGCDPDDPGKRFHQAMQDALEPLGHH